MGENCLTKIFIGGTIIVLEAEVTFSPPDI